MIEFNKVTATYREDVGVFDISFKIDTGEIKPILTYNK